jgi:hypothetical protein
MNTLRITIKLLVITTFMMAFASMAQAQATRTWVSGVGDDVNPCSRTAPCKTFAGAITRTAVNGEINALDNGAFGNVTITKSVTIDGHENFAGVNNSQTTGATISFDSFAGTDVRKTVRLRNIVYQGLDTGLRAIRILGANSGGSEVHVEDCIIDGNFGNPGRGIEDVRSGGGKLFVTNTTVRNNGGTGIVVIPSAGAARIDAVISNVRVFNCGFGIVASSGARMTVTNSIVSGNLNHGFGVEGPVGAAELHISNCQISSNGIGVLQAAGGTVRVGNSEITNSVLNGTSGTVNSYGNNRAGGNAGTTVLTPIGLDTHDKGQS